MTLVRLQKALADAGVVSRRGGEEMIRAGKVSVNGRVMREVGLKIDPDSDRIRVEGKLVRQPSAASFAKVYYLLHKPRGVITSLRDPEGRSTIKDFIPRIKHKVFPVGRLDYDAEGLLLLTNDGDLALHLTHPRYEVPRTYLVKVKGVLGPRELERIAKGVKLEDGMSPAMKVSPIKRLQKNSWVRITLHEGRNRVIKRTFEAIRHPVLRLKRIGFASLTLEGLLPGCYRTLTAAEITQLRGRS
jgi:23S rRNA pseudouridine2605 synthase